MNNHSLGITFIVVVEHRILVIRTVPEKQIIKSHPLRAGIHFFKWINKNRLVLTVYPLG